LWSVGLAVGENSLFISRQKLWKSLRERRHRLAKRDEKGSPGIIKTTERRTIGMIGLQKKKALNG
jgi:hypothetical protein